MSTYVGDHAEFRTWLRGKVLWSQILEKGKLALSNIKKRHNERILDYYKKYVATQKKEYRGSLFKDFIVDVKSRANDMTKKWSQLACMSYVSISILS